MAIAMRLRDYLDRWGAEYERIIHPHSSSSLETAEAAHVSGEKLVKCVLTEDYRGYLMVVVPASHQVEFSLLDDELNRRLELATEDELAELFTDCELGAIPPIGDVYGLDVVMDESLANCDDVYFEAGDHTELIHMRGEDFRDLMISAGRGHFSRHL